MNQLIKRLLREPLLHFLAIGALMFAVYEIRNGNTAPSPDVIIITPQKIAQIKAGFSSVWKRFPDESEINALIEQDIREEVYYRDAIALGLDRNDPLVRQRLRLKMEFLIDSSAKAIDPAVGELETYFAVHELKYQLEPRMAFEQVYLGQTSDTNSAPGLLKKLQSNPEIDLFTVSQRSQLPIQLGLSTRDAVTGVFGTGFYERLVKLPHGIWSGPVKSSFGRHFVRIIDRLPVRTPPLSEVRKDVLRDWKTDKWTEIRDRDYAERRKRFIIEIRRAENPVEFNK